VSGNLRYNNLEVMPDFKDLLKKFDRTLRKCNPKNYAKLQPPLPGREIDHFLDQLHLTHPDFKSLFEWKNGTDLSRGLSKHDAHTDFGVMYPLERIVKLAESAPHKNPHLMKLFGDFSGDGLLFNNDKESEDYGKIFLYSVGSLSIDDPFSYYDSLDSMVKTLIKAYETGMLHYDDVDDYLECDNEKYWKLAKKLNPRSNYWLQR
jgi:hypothetical protein